VSPPIEFFCGVPLVIAMRIGTVIRAYRVKEDLAASNIAIFSQRKCT